MNADSLLHYERLSELHNDAMGRAGEHGEEAPAGFAYYGICADCLGTVSAHCAATILGQLNALDLAEDKRFCDALVAIHAGGILLGIQIAERGDA